QVVTAVARAAVDDLDLDVLGGETVERDVGVDVERLADLGAVTDTGGLHVLDAHLGPRVLDPRGVGGKVAGTGVVVVLERPSRAGCGDVEALGVLAHHAAGPHLGPQSRDRVHDHGE